jgi:hypothetical protein
MNNSSLCLVGRKPANQLVDSFAIWGKEAQVRIDGIAAN